MCTHWHTRKGGRDCGGSFSGLRAGTHLSREEVDLPHFNVNYETLLPEKIQRSFGRLKTTVGNLGVRRSDPQQIIEHIAAMPTRSQ